MNRIPPPTIDDKKIIMKLAENTKLLKTTYPCLMDHLEVVLEQYTHYEEMSGNAIKIEPKEIPQPLRNGLLKHYNSPPQDLKFIENLRKRSPDACPMCGSFHSSTLDHLLPKEKYPLWAVFSKNLIPACPCNSKRGEILTGDIAQGERILHPYFDDCLSNRVVSCRITSKDGFKTINVSLKCLPAPPGVQKALNFHITKIVSRSGILDWIRKKWGQLYLKPSSLLFSLRKKLIANTRELREDLEEYLDWLDEKHGGQNNWESVFVSGILDSEEIIEWLYERHNGIINGTIDPHA